jgi:hypothetical protein
MQLAGVRVSKGSRRGIVPRNCRLVQSLRQEYDQINQSQ